MKYILLICFSMLTLLTLAQGDSMGRKIEPDMETSFENYELLIVAVIGLLLLIGLRFWFWRRKKR
jgi:hypothetical protein